MRPLYLGSAELTRWLTSPLDPVMSRAKTSPTTSPPTLMVSLPRPPMTRVSIPGGVDRTSIVSSPSRVSISSTWMCTYVTHRPTP